MLKSRVNILRKGGNSSGNLFFEVQKFYRHCTVYSVVSQKLYRSSEIYLNSSGHLLPAIRKIFTPQLKIGNPLGTEAQLIIIVSHQMTNATKTHYLDAFCNYLIGVISMNKFLNNTNPKPLNFVKISIRTDTLYLYMYEVFEICIVIAEGVIQYDALNTYDHQQGVKQLPVPDGLCWVQQNNQEKAKRTCFV